MPDHVPQDLKLPVLEHIRVRPDQRFNRLLDFPCKLTVRRNREKPAVSRFQIEQQNKKNGNRKGLPVLSRDFQNDGLIPSHPYVLAMDHAKDRRDQQPLPSGERMVNAFSRLRPFCHFQHLGDLVYFLQQTVRNAVSRVFTVPDFYKLPALDPDILRGVNRPAAHRPRVLRCRISRLLRLRYP